MIRTSQHGPLARNQHGIALMECLMAMLIFSVGLLGLLGLEARVMNISTNSENRNRAAMIAGEVANQMWLNNSVVAAGPVLAAGANAGDQTKGGLPGGVVTIAAVGATTNAADITVTWLEKSDANQSQLTTRVVLP
jgi:type IV pilus assembly protein PilV